MNDKPEAKMVTKRQPAPPEVPAALPTTEPSSLIVGQPLGMLAHYSALPNVEGGAILTTLDLTCRRNVLAVQSALAGGGTSLWDVSPDQVIEVADLIAHFVERVDEESGEIRAGPMLTLVGPAGVYRTGSKYAFRYLQVMGVLCGPPPWRPPIRVRAVRTRSRNKRDYQSVILAE